MKPSSSSLPPLCGLMKLDLTPVADMVFRKTAGNPFLVKALLTSLYDEGIVRFNSRLGSVWDQPQIPALAAADDIGDLPARRIMQIPQDVRKTISLASALGQAFRMETLVTVCGLTVSEVYSHLITACQERVIFKDGEVYRFEHDRLREAAYSLLSADQRPDVHLRIGRLLAQQQGSVSNGLSIFDIVTHLNRAVALIESPKERENLIRLNLIAGRKAGSAAAYSTAFEHFSEALSLLGSNAWETNYELSLALHTEGAETALLSLDFSSADRLVRLVHENARTTLDRIPAYEVQISAAHARLQEQDALGISIEVLKLLGVSIPESPTSGELYDAILHAQAMLNTVFSVEPSGELSVMSDPSKLAAMRILARAVHTGAWTNYTMLHMMACKSLELTIQYGYSPESCVAYLLVGILLCYVLDDYEGGYRAGAFSLKLSERQDSARWRPFCQIGFHATINSWKTPHRSLYAHYGAAHRSALEIGD